MRTHCIKGHELTPENTLVISTRPNQRRCRTCAYETNRRAYRRKNGPPKVRDQDSGLCVNGHDWAANVDSHGRCRRCHADDEARRRERLQAQGLPVTKAPEVITDYERLAAKISISPGGCWLWTARLNEHGYGNFWLLGKLSLAHRASYELHVGPIPEGLTLDHLCRVRRCVNPEHLEPVTQAENYQRGVAARKAAREATPPEVLEERFADYWGTND